MAGKTETGEELRGLVFGAMDYAMTNGYGDAMLRDPLAAVADVQAVCDDAADLIPYIEAWRKKQAN